MTISHSGTPVRTTRRWPRPTLKPGQGLAYRGPPGAFPSSITLLPGLYRAPVRMQQHTWGPSAPHPHLGLFFALRLSRFLKLPALTRAKYQLAGPGGGREGMGRGQGPEAGKCRAQEPVHVPKSEAQVERREHIPRCPQNKSLRVQRKHRTAAPRQALPFPCSEGSVRIPVRLPWLRHPLRDGSRPAILGGQVTRTVWRAKPSTPEESGQRSLLHAPPRRRPRAWADAAQPPAASADGSAFLEDDRHGPSGNTCPGPTQYV